jgi:hypothetical protein
MVPSKLIHVSPDEQITPAGQACCSHSQPFGQEGSWDVALFRGKVLLSTNKGRLTRRGEAEQTENHIADTVNNNKLRRREDSIF